MRTKWACAKRKLQVHATVLQCTDAALHADRQGKLVTLTYLGSKTATDDARWTPDMDAVRATIRFAMATT